MFNLVKSIEDYLTKKIEDMGEEVISQVIGVTPIGATFRILRAVETGGSSEFNRMREAWLNTLQPIMPGTGLARKFDNAFQQAKREAARPGEGWWKWSKTRREWLNEDWRHDWRSQPRDARGRWIPGRLKYIYVSRSVRKRQRAVRRLTRQAIRNTLHGD